MRFLIDNALSPVVAEGLRMSGHDATHVRDHGLADAEDVVIFTHAERDRRVIVSADTDFGTILALREASLPSVILFRGATPKKPDLQVKLLVANLAEIALVLERGAIVVIEPQRIQASPRSVIDDDSPRLRDRATGGAGWHQRDFRRGGLECALKAKQRCLAGTKSFEDRAHTPDRPDVAEVHGGAGQLIRWNPPGSEVIADPVQSLWQAIERGPVVNGINERAGA
jgi:predicted nuclease of predicted toxin-antitoxin system